MKGLRQLLCILFLAGTPLVSWASEGFEGRFDRARAAFENGDWPSAITIYQGLLEDGAHTWALNFNLGKAYFQNNEPGPAIFHLERARAMAPLEAEIPETLAIVREKFTIPHTAPKSWQLWAQRLTPNHWISAVSLFFWIAIACILLPMIKRLSIFDTTAFHFLRIASILCIAFSAIGFSITRSWYQEAIITNDAVTLKLAPTSSSPLLRACIPGEKVLVLDSAREHVYIQLQDGTTGWLSAEDLQRVWL